MSFTNQSRHPGHRALCLMTALAVAASLIFGGVATAVADDGVKIGYVDLHRALEETDEGQRLKRELEREFETRQQRLDGELESVMQKRQEMEQQAMMLSQERQQQMAMELQQEMQKLQETYLTLQNELAQKEAEATTRLFEGMRSVIEEIGEEKGFTMIIERTELSVLYAVDGLDLTDELIRRFNAQD